MMDFTRYPMDLFGAFVAIVVFGIFIGSWWWYAMRPQPAKLNG